MTLDLALLLHHTICGAIAAAGFGVLFNVRYSRLPGCAVTGALALAVRTGVMQSGGSLVAASFFAALTVGIVLQLLEERVGASRSTLAVAGCIPMIPGAVAAKAILGLYAVAAQYQAAGTETLVTSLEFSLRVIFTVGSLGTGLAIPTLLPRFKKATQAG